MHLYNIVDALLIVVLLLSAIVTLGVLTRRIRLFCVESVVSGRYVVEYIVAFCRPGQVEFVATEWVAGRGVRPQRTATPPSQPDP